MSTSQAPGAQAQGGGSQSSQEYEFGGNGIGSMESQIQKLYCFSKVPGEDFVHCMGSDAFNALEDFCSLQNIDSSARNAPLLVVGDRGVGKSALLANWLMKRHRSNQRSRVSGTADEYVFYHAVGCTRQSLKVSTFLRRLITDIKQKCDLSREVPVSHEKLRWELPRFLDLAAKNFRAVIIVIDGLHRLLQKEEDDDCEDEYVTEGANTGDLNPPSSPDSNPEGTKKHTHTSNRADINEGSLSWLPLEFASNVRVILSATLTSSQLQHVVSKYGPKDKEEDILHTSTNPGSNLGSTAAAIDTTSSITGKKHRILQEMERRKWHVMKVHKLEKPQAKSVIEAFLHKSVHSDATAQTMATILTDGEELFNLTATNSMQSSIQQDNDIEGIPGFLLFESQINAILSHPQGTNPLFLRLFLRCAHYAARRGFSLWRIFEDWIPADSVHSLLHRILKTFEVGFDRTRDGCQIDCDRTMASGGLPALRHQYPWHPSFPAQKSHNEDALISAEFRNAIDANKSDIKDGTTGVATNKGDDKGKLSHSVLQNLGDQKWQHVSEQAVITLDEARRNTERSLSITVEAISSKSQESNVSFVEMLLQQVRTLHSDSRKSRANLEHRSDKDAATHETDEAGGHNKTVTRTESDGDNNSDHHLHHHHHHHHHAIHKNSSYESYDDDASADFQSDFSIQTNSDEDDDIADEENGEGDKFDTEVSPANTYSRASIAGLPLKLNPPVQQGASRRPSRFHKKAEHDSDDDSLNSNKRAPLEDPSEDFTRLPMYIRGGSSVKGFGDLIGDALSLLYVARHGLKENELWSILATLHKKRHAGPGISKAKENEKKALIAIFIIARSAIEDLCRNADLHKSGCVSRLQLLKILVKIHPAIQKVDIGNLLVDLGLLPGINENAGFDGIEAWLAEDTRPTLNYMDFLNSLTKVDRQYKLKSTKGRNATKDTSNDFDTLSVGHLVEDERDENDLDFLNMNSHSTSNATSPLGPIMEEALLSVLCALGVIHSPDNQVLALPCDGSVIRKVIKSKYVNGRQIANETMTQESWHGFLIRYFQKERNTMRRCEELPWHLQICRSWVLLRDAVSDLDTFNMMFNSDLREELLGYWLLLTEGPLYTSTEAEVEYAVNPAHSENEHARLLVEIDTAAARGLSEKEARLQLLKGKVAPFDIIEELNASLEVWVGTTKPSTASINYTVNIIAQFLIGYCKQINKSPMFSRVGVEARGLKVFNVNIEVKEAEAKATENDGAADGTDKSVATNSSAGVTNTGVPVNAKFNVTTVLSGNPSLVIPTPAMRDSNLYYYLRWIWLQFPWMALHHAPVVGRRDRAEANLTHQKYTGMSMTKPPNDPMAAPKVDAKTNNNGNNHQSSTETIGTEDVAEHERIRFWNVKKQDPSIAVVDKSGSRKISEVNSYLNDNKTSLDALDMSFKRIYKELLESKDKGPSSSKYRRTFQEELELAATIPHSEHCKKTMRAGTLFPALAANLRSQNEALEKDGKGSIYAEAAQTLKRGGLGLHFQPSIEELISTYNHDETIDVYNQSHAGALPITSVEQVTYSKEFSRLNKLHAVFDRLVSLKNTRKKELEVAKHQFEQRDMLDQEAAGSLIAGETAVTDMQEKFHNLSRSLIAGEELNMGYNQIISLCDSCPPFTQYHLNRLESDVFLARQQLKDLKSHRTNMYIEAQRIELIKKREIYDKYRYYRTARQDVALKKKNFLRTSEAKGYPIPVIERKRDSTPTRSRSPTTLKSPINDESGSSFPETDGSQADSLQKEIERKAIAKLMAPVPDAMAGYADRMNKKREILRSFNNTGTASDVGDEDEFAKDPQNTPLEKPKTPLAPGAALAEPNQTKKKKKPESDVVVVTDKTELANLATSAFANMLMSPMQKALHNAKKIQSKMTVDYIAEKTGFHTAEELIDRYNAANKMAENLKSHQILADSRLAQLRAEYTDLYSSLGDSYYLSLDDSANGSEKDKDGAIVEHDSRYLDNKLFASEMRLNALKKQHEKTLYILNEVKMGICHIISLLQANNRMLGALPRVSPPRVLTDADLSTGISWVEERVLAINEAMMLESAKPTANTQANGSAPIDGGADQGISNRQNELASIVMNSIIRRRGGLAPVNIKSTKEKKKSKSAGGMSKNIIDISENNATFISSPRNVMITSTNEIDKTFDDKIKRLEDKRDKRAQLLEQLEGIDNNINAVKGVGNFVLESLHNNDSLGLLRKANIIASRKQGRFAGLGIAMEDVLKAKGPAYLTAATDIGPKPSVHANSALLSNKKGEKKGQQRMGGGGNVEAKGSDKNTIASSQDDDGTFGGSFMEGSEAIGADN